MPITCAFGTGARARSPAKCQWQAAERARRREHTPSGTAGSWRSFEAGGRESLLDSELDCPRGESVLIAARPRRSPGPRRHSAARDSAWQWPLRANAFHLSTAGPKMRHALRRHRIPPYCSLPPNAQRQAVPGPFLTHFRGDTHTTEHQIHAAPSVPNNLAILRCHVSETSLRPPPPRNMYPPERTPSWTGRTPHLLFPSSICRRRSLLYQIPRPYAFLLTCTETLQRLFSCFSLGSHRPQLHGGSEVEG